MIRCPKCGSGKYYYDGAFIRCLECKFIEYGLDCRDKWKVELEVNINDYK